MIAQATAAVTRLKPNEDKTTYLLELMRALVMSIFMNVCDSWTMTAEVLNRTHAFEKRCYRRLLNNSWKDHVTNEDVRSKTKAVVG